ncbi:hypothetical protein H9Q13_09765 [Pontibacter sp. JH31]|uniref:Uncharacterized protein n=1 Tax=Pontibacter aquaedesilientis TaxID=2766980 RepID=A0ABR7XGN1_9BACT|nr:hypothetical protein [Pontibacter aquaedesilientis]MBD1397452.1 hypothetical protein [Pontibacter aquaedesilientis]
MTRYLLLFLTGFAHALLILLYTDLSGDDALFYRTMGLAAAVPLFGFSSWLTLFTMRVGALLSIPSLLVLIYWNLRTAEHSMGQDTAFDTTIAIIHLVAGLLAMVTLMTSLRYVFKSELSWVRGTPSPGLILKLLLAAIPIAVAVAYVLYA